MYGPGLPFQGLADPILHGRCLCDAFRFLPHKSEALQDKNDSAFQTVTRSDEGHGKWDQTVPANGERGIVH